MPIQPDHTTESQKWFEYFSMRRTTAIHVSPAHSTQLTTGEISTVTKSIQQFQLGEGSKGQRLLDRGRKYAQAMDDPLFYSSLELFIKEEQRHSRYLEAFMRSQGIPRVASHWVDSVFRSVRGWAGLELSLTVLVTAEFIAVPYYRALRDATGSSILKMICKRILEDEAAHLRYQSSMLGRIASKRREVLQQAISMFHSLFLLGTIIVVWFDHHGVFEAAGYTFQRFKKETLHEFAKWGHLRRACSVMDTGGISITQQIRS